VACCDLVAGKMVDPRSQRAVGVALRHANGMASDDELELASLEAEAAVSAVMTAGGPGRTDQTGFAGEEDLRPESVRSPSAACKCPGGRGVREPVRPRSLSTSGVAFPGVLGRRSGARK
jgi:hypothetical protein